MKLLDMIKTANSNLWRNKSRTFLTVLAIFIGAFTIIMTTGINTGVNGYIDKQMAAAGMKNYMDVMPGSDSSAISTGGLSFGGDVSEYNPDKSASLTQTISESQINSMEKIDGVESARGFTMISPEYITSARTDKKWQLSSISAIPTTDYNLDFAAGKMVDNDSNELQIDIQDKYLAPLGFANAREAIGQTVKIAVMEQISVATTPKIDIIEAKIVGVLNASVISMGRNYTNNALADALYDAQMIGLPDSYKNQFYFAGLTLKWSEPTEEQYQAVKDGLKKLNLTGMTTDDEVGMIKTFFDAITTVLTIFGVIALIAASIGIINTLFMAVQERTREIGLMKAMGLSRAKIFAMFSFEAIALGFWGGMIGVGLAYVAKVVANHLATTTFLKDLPGFTLIEFNPVSLIVIVAIIMLIAFLAGTLPARRAAKKDPIDALRYE